MMTFSEQWVSCMHENHLPVPSVEDAHEALELLDKLNQAIENAGGDAEVTIGALLLAGAIVGVDEVALAVLAEAGGIVATAYLAACIGCLGSVGLDELRDLFAVNEVPDFVVTQLQDQGVDLGRAVA